MPRRLRFFRQYNKGGELWLGFTDPLDRAAATDAKNYSVKVWSLKRTASYGSPHVNEHALVVRAATLSEDGKTVALDVENLAPYLVHGNQVRVMQC